MESTIKNLKLILITTLLTTNALLVQARENITVVWPFGIGDTQAQYTRSLIDVANQEQKDYLFIFNNKPGAGASIAAKYVINHPNTVLAGSTSFFVRPTFFPGDSHDPTKFRPLMTQCAAPMVIISGKYRSFKELQTNQRITIGISGLGATTHLVAMELKQKYSGIEVIPYKGTREASIDVMNNNIDLAVGFMGEIEQYIAGGKLYALGITGKVKVNGIPLLADQGFKNARKMVNMHSWLVPVSMPEDQYIALRKIAVSWSRSPSVQASYNADYCQDSNLNNKQTQEWFDEQMKMWKDLSLNVKLQ